MRWMCCCVDTTNDGNEKSSRSFEFEFVFLTLECNFTVIDFDDRSVLCSSKKNIQAKDNNSSSSLTLYSAFLLQVAIHYLLAARERKFESKVEWGMKCRQDE